MSKIISQIYLFFKVYLLIHLSYTLHLYSSEIRAQITVRFGNQGI